MSSKQFVFTRLSLFSGIFNCPRYFIIIARRAFCHTYSKNLNRRSHIVEEKYEVSILAKKERKRHFRDRGLSLYKQNSIKR